MKKWEYLYIVEYFDYQADQWVIAFTDDAGERQEYPIGQKQALLGDLGKEGWELVSVDSYVPGGSKTMDTKLYFKRELED